MKKRILGSAILVCTLLLSGCAELKNVADGYVSDMIKEKTKTPSKQAQASEEKPKGLSGTYTPDPNRTEDTVIILGTYTWDVDSNKLGVSQGKEFYWSIEDDISRELSVGSGAKQVIIKNKAYDEIDGDYLQTLTYTELSLKSGRVEEIPVGSIIGFITTEGRYGKLIIEGYKDSHDFSFKEAYEYYDDGYKEYMLSREKQAKYHLVIRYKLY